MSVDSTKQVQEAPAPIDPPAEVELFQSASADVDIACGNHGALCDAVLEWSGDETLAETVSWVVGVPFKIVVIVLIALLASRLARGLIRRVTTRLRPGR